MSRNGTLIREPSRSVRNGSADRDDIRTVPTAEYGSAYRLSLQAAALHPRTRSRISQAPCEMVRTLSSSLIALLGGDRRRPPSRPGTAATRSSMPRCAPAHTWAGGTSRVIIETTDGSRSRSPHSLGRRQAGPSPGAAPRPGRRSPRRRARSARRHARVAASASIGPCTGRWSGPARRSARRGRAKTSASTAPASASRSSTPASPRGTTISARDRVVHFVDFVDFQPLAYDDYGHGTHVAGIIAGSGYDSNGARTRHGAGREPHRPEGPRRRRQRLHQQCHRGARLRGRRTAPSSTSAS